MKSSTLGKVAGGAVATALLLGGTSIAFAQTYANPDGTGSIIPTSATPSVQQATGTGSTGTTGTTGTGSTGTTGTTGSGTTGTGTTPGIPNTGAGDPATWAVLGISAAIAVGGAALLMRQRTVLG